MSKLDERTEAREDRESSARVVWTLAWPAVALNSLQIVNTLLDRGFIGHLEGAALAAHGAAVNVMFLAFSLAMALGTATTAIVSRAYGAGRVVELRTAARQGVMAAFLFGAIFAALCAVSGPAAGSFLLPPESGQARRLMSEFLVAYGSGLPAIYLIQSIAGSLRGIGDTRSPMVISGIQIVSHIVLNFVFIFPPTTVSGVVTIPGFGWGLTGAGVALSASAWIAASIYLAYLGRTPLGEAWRPTMPRFGWMRRILAIAAPAAGNAVLRVGSLAAFTRVLRDVPNGETAIAAMSVGFAIESIMFMPAFGLSVAAGALVGQSLGMRRPDRAMRLGWVAGHHSAAVTGLIAIPIFVAAPWIAHGMVGGKGDIAVEAASLIRILCATEVFFAYAMTMIGAIQGAGDTVRPFWITVICMWLLRVPMAWILAIGLEWGAVGAWVAMSATQGVQGLMALWLFKQGRWVSHEV